MKNIKRFFCAVVCLVLVLCAAFPASAVEVANRKSSLSKFAGKGKLTAMVEKLHSFDDTKGISGAGTIDTGNKKEGTGSYSYTLTSDGDSRVFDISGFTANASKCDTLTFRMWIYISDMTLLNCDHQTEESGDLYANSGTIYFRFRSNGVDSCVNHTIEGTGWQLCEFTLEHHNGKGETFDPNNITGAWLMVAGKKGLTVKVDGLEAVYYSNDGYTDDNSSLPEGATLISNCEYDGLAGEVITEWYNSDYSTEDPKQGKSSLVLKVDGGDDERMFWGGLDLTIGKDDVFCFWIKIDNIKAISGGNIEINEVQDRLEYETVFTTVLSSTAIDRLEKGKWNLIMIPISSMTFGVHDDYADRKEDTELNIHNIRINPGGSGNGETNVYIDQMFFMSKADAAAYKRQLKGIGVSSTASASENLTSSESDSGSSSDGMSTGLIIGIVVAVGAVAVVIIIIASKKKKA